MKLFAAIFLGVLAAIPVSAHEYWFEADNFFLKLRQSTAVHLFTGEALKKEEERPFQASKTRSFDLYSPSGNFDLRTMAEDGKLPIFDFSADAAGTYMLTMEREWASIKLGADEFEDYLREVGLDYVITERKRLDESKTEGRERYSRFLKAMFQVGDNRTGNIKTRIGSRIEIVPLKNPYSNKLGGSSAFQFWFDDRVLSDYTVFVDNRDGDNVVTRKLTTDSDGRATVKFERKGIWLVRVVYMQRCRRYCGEADWESFWGALSFGVK